MKDKAVNKNILSRAYDIFSNKFKTILILTLIFYIPFYFLAYVGDRFAILNFVNTFNVMGIEFSYGEILSMFIVMILNFIFTPVFMGSIYFVVMDYVNGEEIDYKKIINKSIKLWPIFFMTIVIFYFLLFCSAWFIILTPFVFTIFYFNTFAICEGNRNPIKALKVSYKSIKGKIFISFAIIFLTSILNSFIGNILFSFVNLSDMPSNVLVFMFYNTINTIISAYFYIFLSLWYKNVYDTYLENGGLNEH